MSNFTLNKFRDFINSVPDDIFPGAAPAPQKNVNDMSDDELQRLLIDIIRDYPNRFTSGRGPRINGIFQCSKTLKHKDRVRAILEKLYQSNIAAQGTDGRWYIIENAYNNN